MGFKDLPGSTTTEQSQSAAKKSTASQDTTANDALSKQESLTNTKSSQ